MRGLHGYGYGLRFGFGSRGGLLRGGLDRLFGEFDGLRRRVGRLLGRRRGFFGGLLRRGGLHGGGLGGDGFGSGLGWGGLCDGLGLGLGGRFDDGLGSRLGGGRRGFRRLRRFRGHFELHGFCRLRGLGGLLGGDGGLFGLRGLLGRRRHRGGHRLRSFLHVRGLHGLLDDGLLDGDRLLGHRVHGHGLLRGGALRRHDGLGLRDLRHLHGLGDRFGLFGDRDGLGLLGRFGLRQLGRFGRFRDGLGLHRLLGGRGFRLGQRRCDLRLGLGLCLRLRFGLRLGHRRHRLGGSGHRLLDRHAVEVGQLARLVGGHPVEQALLLRLRDLGLGDGRALLIGLLCRDRRVLRHRRVEVLGLPGGLRYGFGLGFRRRLGLRRRYGHGLHRRRGRRGGAAVGERADRDAAGGVGSGDARAGRLGRPEVERTAGRRDLPGYRNRCRRGGRRHVGGRSGDRRLGSVVRQRLRDRDLFRSGREERGRVGEDRFHRGGFRQRLLDDDLLHADQVHGERRHGRLGLRHVDDGRHGGELVVVVHRCDVVRGGQRVRRDGLRRQLLLGERVLLRHQADGVLLELVGLVRVVLLRDVALRVPPGTLRAGHQQLVVLVRRHLGVAGLPDGLRRVGEGERGCGGGQERVGAPVVADRGGRSARAAGVRLLNRFFPCAPRQSLAGDRAGVSHACPSPIGIAPSSPVMRRRPWRQWLSVRQALGHPKRGRARVTDGTTCSGTAIVPAGRASWPPKLVLQALWTAPRPAPAPWAAARRKRVTVWHMTRRHRKAAQRSASLPRDHPVVLRARPRDHREPEQTGQVRQFGSVPPNSLVVAEGSGQREQRRPLAFGPVGVQLDRLHECPFDLVAALGERPVDGLRLVAGDGGCGDAFGTARRAGGDHLGAAARDPHDVRLGEVLQRLRCGAVDDLALDAVAAGVGGGERAGVGVPVDGDHRGAEPGRLHAERAAARADVPHQVAGARAEPGQLQGAQLGGAPGGARFLPVVLGGQRPAARRTGVAGVLAGHPAAGPRWAGVPPITITTLGSRQMWSATLSEVSTVTSSRSVPSASQMTNVRCTPPSSSASSAGPAPGAVSTATLGCGPASR